MKLVCAFALLVAMTGQLRAEESPPLQPLRFDGELAARGHRNQIVGGALMGVGTASIVTSIALIVDGAFRPRTFDRCAAGVSCEKGSPLDLNQVDAGVAMAVLGTILTLAGVGTYSAGLKESDRAQPQLRLTASGLRLEF